MRPEVVSIIMPAYNAAEYIGFAIESALAQSYPHLQLVIVNDGSTDNTGDIALRYSDLRITLIHQKNGGEAAARNTALDHVNGDFIAFLDADDLFKPDHLEKTLHYLQKNADRDAVYTDGYHIDHSGARMSPISKRRRGPFEGNLYEYIVRASDVFGPPGCVVLRSEVVTYDCLRFDPDIGYGTDWDLWTRLSATTQFGYINEATYLYRIHPTNLTLSTKSIARNLAWAKCRSKAIKMDRFNTCTIETRWAVFYDLLVTLLNGYPERQNSVIQWPEFRNLPEALQSKLLRLMASQAIVGNRNQTYAEKWLNLANRLYGLDRRGKLLFTLYRFSPVICRLLLRARMLTQPQSSEMSLSDFMG
jgi:glycosyltransferase involved in cell wall biosynthesis